MRSWDISGESCRNLKRGQTTGFPCQMHAIPVLSRQKNGRVITWRPIFSFFPPPVNYLSDAAPRPRLNSLHIRPKWAQSAISQTPGRAKRSKKKPQYTNVKTTPIPIQPAGDWVLGGFEIDADELPHPRSTIPGKDSHEKNIPCRREPLTTDSQTD